MSVGLYYPIAILCCYIIAIAEWLIRVQVIKEGVHISKVPYITYFVCGSFFIVMGVFQWFKYRLWIYPVLGILIGLATFQAPFCFANSSVFTKGAYLITIFIIALFVIFNWSAFYSQERFEINSRRLFRLAAALIRDTSGGFTERPYSAGKLVFKQEDLLGLFRFLNGRYVVRTFYMEDRVYLAFSMNRSLVGLEDPKAVSYVVIDFNGNYSVFISGKDYQQYVARFSFDQLCSSMAALFERFLSYYQQGMENRIITELKSAR
jgi:hypothetical protein